MCQFLFDLHCITESIPNIVSLLNLCSDGPGSRSLLHFDGVAGPDKELRRNVGLTRLTGVATGFSLISGTDTVVLPRRTRMIMMIIRIMISIDVQIIWRSVTFTR